VAQRRDPSRLSPRAERDEAIKPQVRRVFDANFKVYGVRKAIVQSMRELPGKLRRSLTWDQGAEMAQHAKPLATRLE